MLKLSANNIRQPGHWLIFSNEKVIVPEGTELLPLLNWSDVSFIHHYQDQVKLLHAEDLPLQHPLYIVDLGAESVTSAGWQSMSLRQLMTSEPPLTFETLARAWQFVHFARTHRFCGRCGNHTQPVDWEMAVQCHQCGHRCYPRVSPCTIVAIHRGQELLLARGVRHRDPNMYSILAGFVESGESLEQATHREVFEEVGLKIKNLEYFGSQAWPFPHSLMVGYFAEYDSGDIVIDKREIVDANWFNVNDLPLTAPKISIAGKMIDAISERLKAKK
ncbi:MAG: NAD(+) diphosphatase [Alteromonadaceae bacterium]|nr:NAD(+) diphosphatase [Alteromonadaceae bacterium]